MKRYFIYLLFVCLVIPPSFAAIPEKINVQGIVYDSQNKPVISSTQIDIGIFDVENGGSPIWYDDSGTETNPDPKTGLFTVVLGSSPSFPLNILSFDKQYWVEFSLTLNGTPLKFRQPFRAAPYAITAKNVKYSDAIGVFGSAGQGNGVKGEVADAGIAILGENKGVGGGVKGLAAEGEGVIGESNDGWGIRGKGTSGGAYLESSAGFGIRAQAPRNKLIGETFIDIYNGTTNSGGALRFAGSGSTAQIGSNMYLNEAGEELKHARTGGVSLISLDTTTGNTAGDINFYTGPSKTANSDVAIQQKMVIKQSGKVGIGTTDPGGMLTVHRDDGNALMLQTGATNKWTSLYFGESGGAARLGIQKEANNDMSIWTATGAKGAESWTRRMTLTAGGNFGIGTSSPGAKLHIKGAGFPNSFLYLDTTAADQDSGVRLYENGAVKAHFYHDASANVVRLDYEGQGTAFVLGSNGNFGLGVEPLSGSRLHTKATSGNSINAWNTNGNGVYGVSDTGGIGVYGKGLGTSQGVFGYSQSNYGGYFRSLNYRSLGVEGSIYASGSLVVNPMDVAEWIKASDPSVVAGDVVVIDPNIQKSVTKSNIAYSSLVAGIVSTDPAILAGAIKTGDVVAGVTEMTQKGYRMLALAGQVPCNVCDEGGPIAVGDMLTTSSTPGYAMKVTDKLKAIGAVVGKALEPLASGKGKITVLVTLQ